MGVVCQWNSRRWATEATSEPQLVVTDYYQKYRHVSRDVGAHLRGIWIRKCKILNGNVRSIGSSYCITLRRCTRTNPVLQENNSSDAFERRLGIPKTTNITVWWWRDYEHFDSLPQVNTCTMDHYGFVEYIACYYVVFPPGVQYSCSNSWYSIVLKIFADYI